MRRLFRPSALLALLAFPTFAWWETGHEVVARIAAAHLTPQARARVAHILGVPDNPRDVANAMAEASVWADHIKGSTKTAPWHYIDIGLRDRRADISSRCPAESCLPVQITYFRNILKTQAQGPEWTQAEALKFLIHLIGDSAQPLHAADDADKGGNCELLAAPLERAKNLHSLWDGGIVNTMGEGSYRLAADLDQQIDRMPRRELHRLERGSVDDWIWDSHKIAKLDIYDRLHLPSEPEVHFASCTEAPRALASVKLEIPPGYVNQMQPVVRSQLIKGGLRLALVLNEIL